MIEIELIVWATLAAAAPSTTEHFTLDNGIEVTIVHAPEAPNQAFFTFIPLGLLEAGDNPVVMNTSSQLGSMVIGAKMPSDVAYNVSKAAVNMVTVMSASTNTNVCFVALHPGWVKTDMGTDAAELEVPDAAAAIIESLLGLTIEDSGRFIRWDGTDHPW